MLTFSAYAVRAVRLESSGPAAATRITVCDDQGAVHLGRADLNPSPRWIAENTNRDGYTGDLAGTLRGADVFIGLPAPGILTGQDIPSVFHPDVTSSVAAAVRANATPDAGPAGIGRAGLDR